MKHLHKAAQTSYPCVEGSLCVWGERLRLPVVVGLISDYTAKADHTYTNRLVWKGFLEDNDRDTVRENGVLL